MDFDRFTVVLLLRRPDAPPLEEAEANALQDAHLEHLTALRESGEMLVAGPLRGDDRFRGLCIFKVEPDQARALMDQDPTVRAGRLSIEVLPWMVPAGSITFPTVAFPRSMAEAEGG